MLYMNKEGETLSNSEVGLPELAQVSKRTATASRTKVHMTKPQAEAQDHKMTGSEFQDCCTEPR